MQAETVDAPVLRPLITLKELFPGEAVFRLLWFADKGVAAAQRSGVVTETEQLGQTAVTFQEREVADIVQIYDSLQFTRLLILRCRCVIRRKYDLVAGQTDLFSQQELRQGAAVCAETLFFQQFKYVGIGSCFNSKELLKSRSPGKNRIKPAGVFPYCLFIIDKKGGRVLGDDFFDLVFCKG